MFVNNFCVPELQTMTFLTQEETMVMRISTALSSPNFHSPNFHSGESSVKKIRVYFLAICTNFSCKIENLNACVWQYISIKEKSG